jgi:hypothetical protein
VFFAMSDRRLIAILCGICALVLAVAIPLIIWSKSGPGEPAPQPSPTPTIHIHSQKVVAPVQPWQPSEKLRVTFYAVAIFVAAIALIYLWLLPINVANGRLHTARDAIQIMTILAIFLPILWIIALIWAHTQDNRERKDVIAL